MPFQNLYFHVNENIDYLLEKMYTLLLSFPKFQQLKNHGFVILLGASRSKPFRKIPKYLWVWYFNFQINQNLGVIIKANE